MDNDLLEWIPEAVAEFLYKEEGLNKTAIGDFLGERYDDGYIFVVNTACGSDMEKKIFPSCIHRRRSTFRSCRLLFTFMSSQTLI